MAEAKFEKSNEDELTEDILDNIKRARDHQKKWIQEAYTTFEFYAGRQYTEDEEAELEEDLRPAITFNRVGPVIDAVHGHQLNNEMDIRFDPTEVNDDPWASLYSQVIRKYDRKCDALEDIADAFMDAVICGMGWTEMYMDYSRHPDGYLYPASHVPVLEMGWDPNAKKRNLSDRKFQFRKKWWRRREAEMRWPKLKAIVAEDTDNELDEILEEPHDASSAWKYSNDSSRYYHPRKKEVLITHYQWYDTKPIYRVAYNGQILELSPGKFEKLKESLDMMQAPYVKQEKRFYKEAWLAGPHRLEMQDIDVNEFTYHCMTGKRDANKNWWFGIVRGMIDPQKWSNKFFAEMQDFMAANRQGGAFVEESALVDPRKAEEDWNRHDALIMLADGGVGRIRERQQVNYPQGLDRLLQIAISAIPDTSGINLEMLGLVDRNQPGVLEAQRKRSSINILSVFFKSLTKYQKERGRCALKFIDAYMSDGRIEKITGEEGAKLIRMEKNQRPDIFYDIDVDEAPTSPNQKEETFAIIMQMIPFLKNMGLSPPPSVLKYTPLPKTMVAEWIQSAQQQKPDPLMIARVKKEESSAELNKAKAQGEIAGAQESLADAEKSKAQAQREMANIENDELNAIDKLTR